MAVHVPADTDMAPAHLQAMSPPNPYVISTNTPLILLAACGETHAWDAKVKAGEAVSWWSGKPGGGSAKQVIGRYDGVTGADVVVGIRRAMSCGTVKYKDAVYALKTELSMPKFAGSDAQFAFCAEYPGAQDLDRCFLLLAVGDRASAFVADGYPQTQREMKTMLTAAGPAIAAALGKA
jgi:hypothetical protein